MTARIARLGLAALGLLFLAACSSPIVGTVAAKEFDPGYYWTQHICIAYDEDSVCIDEVAIDQWHPDDWILIVDTADGERSASGDETEWGRTEIDDPFDNTPADQRETRRR